MGVTLATLKVAPRSCEDATQTLLAWLKLTYTSSPRTARMGLSVPAWVRSATTTDQVSPKSSERATTVSLLPFCSQAA